MPPSLRPSSSPTCLVARRNEPSNRPSNPSARNRSLMDSQVPSTWQPSNLRVSVTQCKSKARSLLGYGRSCNGWAWTDLTVLVAAPGRCPTAAEAALLATVAAAAAHTCAALPGSAIHRTTCDKVFYEIASRRPYTAAGPARERSRLPAASVKRHGKRRGSDKIPAARLCLDGASVPGSWRCRRHAAAAVGRAAAAAAAAAVHSLLAAAGGAALCLRASTHGCAHARHQATPPGERSAKVVQLCCQPHGCLAGSCRTRCCCGLHGARLMARCSTDAAIHLLVSALSSCAADCPAGACGAAQRHSRSESWIDPVID